MHMHIVLHLLVVTTFFEEPLIFFQNRPDAMTKGEQAVLDTRNRRWNFIFAGRVQKPPPWIQTHPNTKGAFETKRSKQKDQEERVEKED